MDDDDIEMGFEMTKGHYVTFEKDELAIFVRPRLGPSR